MAESEDWDEELAAPVEDDLTVPWNERLRASLLEAAQRQIDREATRARPTGRTRRRCAAARRPGPS